ncbi:hypothetical protein BOX15_Mlig005433g2 [Macrostomum lignano]|uniref:AIG1-type G domain-containing protein n=1 Tax=Macrostomum lignano TaxID=282301 RepID=A0A267GD76_9PLAT|nr:hypothetical protein BOX15_Mlig005433g2 [Macrostomum lignano]
MASSRPYVSELSTIRGPLKEAGLERSQVPLTLMLLGKTGNGKSSLGNALLGCNESAEAPFQVKSGFISCQEHEPRLEEGIIQERPVNIIDTPGVLDNVNDEQALDGICKAISLNPGGVTAFVIVLRADSRFTKEESKAVDQLQSLFGDKFWDHAICVFTHGDVALRGGQAAFESQLKIARQQVSNLDKILNKVGVRWLIVDCHNLGRSKLTEFVLMLDSVRSKNKGECYTNALFKEAQLRYAKANGPALLASLWKAKKELRELKEDYKQLKYKISKQLLEEKIKALEGKIKGQETQICKLHQDLADAIKPAAKKYCVLL